MENEVVNNKKNNTGIIVAVVVVLVIVAVVVFFLLSGKGGDETLITGNDNKLDDQTLNLSLSYLGIGADGKPNGFNDAVVARGISGDNYDVEEFVIQYATVNNLFEKDEYVNDNVKGCETNNDEGDFKRFCFLLSKDDFNMITKKYNIDYNYDKVDTENKVDGKYLYKKQVVIEGNFSEYKYTINSAVYEDEAKTKIVIDTTRDITDLLTEAKSVENIKFYLTKNENEVVFDKVEVIEK